MGLREDLKRFNKVGEEERQDLEDFIKYGEMDSGEIKIPIKVVDLPEFEYDKFSMGGIGQGEGEVGDPVDVDVDADGDEDGEGEEGGGGEGEHGYYEMDPEQFAEELDDRLGLDLDPKGKKVKEITEGAMVEKVRSGPDATVDFEELFKKGLKRELALFFDEDYLREVLKVSGMGVEETFKWARKNNIPVSKAWIKQEYQKIQQKDKYNDIDDIEEERRRQPTARELNSVQLRKEDKRHKYPEIKKEYEKNAVVIFIRDVSGSMDEGKRDLVERVFTPLDWYLTGKYDNAEFHYIAHDSQAWEVEREDFFGIKSGGGTIISSAYYLAQELLEQEYPWSEWNRYVFCAGDGENFRDNTSQEVIPLMEEIDCNLHGYVEVESKGGWTNNGVHGEELESHFGEDSNVAVTYLDNKDDVMETIETILSTEESE